MMAGIWIGGMGLMAAIFSAFVARLVVSLGLRYRNTYTHEAGHSLAELFLFIDPAQLWTLAGLLAFMLFALTQWLSGSLVLALLVSLVSLKAPRQGLRYLHRRRLRRFDTQLPEMLQALSYALRAGASLPVALRRLMIHTPAPLSQEMGLVLREQRIGVPLDTALRALSVRIPTRATVLMVAALRTALATGGNLAQMLERMAALLRARNELGLRVKTLTAQGRMQAWIVGALPVLLALALQCLEPQAMALLWHTPPGWAAIAVMVTLESVGFWMIRRIVDIRV